MIEHLVLSGAGTNGLIQLGLLNYLQETNYFKLSDIKTIYGTSAGAIISILLLIGVSITELKEYFINRPWDKFFDIDLDFQQKGIFQISYLYEMVKPFMLAYDIPQTFTLLDLYNKTNIELHIFTTKLNHMMLIDLNHVTFPSLTLTEAINMTASLPLIFPPVKYDNEYYIDGGILQKCPLQSIQKTSYSNDSILIIDIGQQRYMYSEESSVLDFIHLVMSNAFQIISTDRYNKTCITNYPHYYYIIAECILSTNVWDKFINDIEYRKQLYETGYNYKKIEIEIESIKE